MEYREGRCPKCNEIMQIPVGREKIICMFCGQEFSVEDGKKADEAAYEAELAAFGQNIGSLFVDIEKTVKGFQRTEYEGSFEAYRIAHKELLQASQRIMHAAPDKKAAAEEVAELFVAQGGEFMKSHGQKLNCKSEQMTLNMYMVTYVIPAILSLDNGKYSDITEHICQKWAAAFKDSKIQAASYESLSSGFRKKLCYVTTAVCKSIHRPQDCHELEILKQYRDGYLSAEEGGRELIREYYDIAPTIVKRVDKREDKEEIYRCLYEAYISPCVRFIEEGRNEECLSKYQEMVEMLRMEYLHG